MSAAFSWRDGNQKVSRFVIGEDKVRQALVEVGDRPVVVHNYSFEYMVTKMRYPDLRLNFYADTMRLAQVYDNGGDKSAFEVVIDESEPLDPDELPEVKKISTAGFSLVKCAFRILKRTTDHKKEAYDWIRENVPKSKGKEGQYLDRLPHDILDRYNVGDTEVTLDLFEFLIGQFKSLEYDWTFDHQLYMSTARYVVDAKVRGIRVDRDRAAASRAKVAAEISTIESEFSTKYATQIAEVEADRLATYLSKVKTDKGKAKRLAKYTAGDSTAVKEVRFNAGSNAQLAHLFMRKMGIMPKLFTAKGDPSFRSSHLSQWGEPGLMLQARRKKMLLVKQLDALLVVSEYDGRWHADLKMVGTATGRAAGGSQ